METKGFYNAKSNGTNALTLIWKFWTVQKSILTNFYNLLNNSRI